MANEYTETKTTGYGTRIIDSIKGIIFGLLLFLGSFVLLYLNEGTADLSVLAKTAHEIPSTPTTTINVPQESLVWTTGSLSSQEMIGDNLFLTPGHYIAITRSVEVYAWEEKQESTTQKNLGGSETTQTKYTYEKKWLQNPVTSHNFKHPEGHDNPTPSISEITIKAHKATLGTYEIDMATVTLPHFGPLMLNGQTTTLNSTAQLADGQHIFVSTAGGSTVANPQVGDLKISYNVLPSGTTATIFGKLNGSTITSYVNTANHTLYRIFSGTHDQAIDMLHTEYSTFVWILRLVGFLMMWIGLFLLTGPVNVFLDIVPLFGSLSRSLIALITFFIALPLTIVTIVISMIMHNIIALIIALTIILIIIVAWLKKMSKKAAPQKI